MKKTIFAAIIALLLSLSLASAITQQEISEAKNLVDSGADCRSLSDSQLEIIGKYHMEQMHPGEAHGLMHKIMGVNESAEAEKQFHINIAKTMYCGKVWTKGSGNMMNITGGMMGSYPTGYGMMPMMNMMSGMAGCHTQQGMAHGNMMNSGMTGNGMGMAPVIGNGGMMR